MLIVDSQVHIWAADRPERPWPKPTDAWKPVPHRSVPLTADVLLADMAAAGIDRVILVPPSFEGDYNDVVLEACRRHPDRFRFAARMALDDPAGRELVASWRRNAGMVALQLTFQHSLFQKPLLSGEINWLWTAAERAGLPLQIFVSNTLMPHIERTVQKHPGLKVLVNHLGLTAGHDEGAFVDYANLLALARYPNVAVKASCMPFYSKDAYPFPKLHPFMRQALDAFGPTRYFWGTDYSRLPASCSYRQSVTMFTEELPWLKGADLELVMGRGICEWIGWER